MREIREVYLELADLVDEFCLRSLEFSALDCISRRFNAEKVMMVDSNQPDSLRHSLDWPFTTRLYGKTNLWMGK